MNEFLSRLESRHFLVTEILSVRMWLGGRGIEARSDVELVSRANVGIASEVNGIVSVSNLSGLSKTTICEARI